MAPNSLEEHLRLLQSFCRYNANHNHHKHSAFVTYPDIVSVSHPRGVAPCPCLPFLLPSSMSHSQSQRLLAFGVDARILNLRLITIFTSYSLARSLALCLPSVRPSSRGSCSCCRNCCWKRRRCCCSCCTSCLARTPALPRPARPRRGMLLLGAGPRPPPLPPPPLPLLSGRFFFPHVR